MNYVVSEELVFVVYSALIERVNENIASSLMMLMYHLMVDRVSGLCLELCVVLLGRHDAEAVCTQHSNCNPCA